MNTLDTVLLVAAGIGILFGLKSGLIKQLSFGASVAIGLLQATIFYPRATAWLPNINFAIIKIPFGKNLHSSTL